MAQHLIHIGYPKTGSNLLRTWFAVHPQLKFAHGGIAGFNDVYQLSQPLDPHALWHVTSDESLSVPRHGMSFNADRNEAQQWMEQCQRDTCLQLEQLFPNAHILIVTRGFRALIYSSYSQYVRVGGTEDFEGFLSRGGANPWHFDWLIDLYRGQFGGRVILLPFELLAQNMNGFLRELETRLGLDHAEFDAPRENPSLHPRELHWYPLIARLSRRLPFGSKLGRIAAKASFENRLAPIIRLLDRIRPAPPFPKDRITVDMLTYFKGTAATLAEEPVYAPFAADYLF